MLISLDAVIELIKWPQTENLTLSLGAIRCRVKRYQDLGMGGMVGCCIVERNLYNFK